MDQELISQYKTLSTEEIVKKLVNHPEHLNLVHYLSKDTEDFAQESQLKLIDGHVTNLNNETLHYYMVFEDLALKYLPEDWKFSKKIFTEVRQRQNERALQIISFIRTFLYTITDSDIQNIQLRDLNNVRYVTISFSI